MGDAPAVGMSSDDARFGVACPSCKRLNLELGRPVGETIVCFACGASIQVHQTEQRPVKAVLPPQRTVRARRSEIDKRASFGERTTVTFQDFAEKDWGEESGPNSRPKANRRSGAVALAGIALTCTLAASVFVLSREKPTLTPSQSHRKEPASLPSSLTIAERFLFASSPEERLQWVRDPEKHEAAIRQHFDAFGPETAATASLEEQVVIEEQDGIISSFRAVLADGKSRLICVLQRNKGRVLNSRQNDQARRTSRRFGGVLKDQHAVTVGIESITLGDSLGIRLFDEVRIGEGADEHEEGGLWQVKVGEQCPDAFELKAGIDEDRGGSGAG